MKEFIKKISNWALENLHLLVALFLLIYTIIPILSPILFELGLDRYGWWIQTIYRMFCHQRPERSFFLFGEKISYSLQELKQAGYTPELIGYTFIGNNQLGYKIAFCSRDLFIYGSMALSGLFVYFYKKPIKIKWWIYPFLILPMIIDGTTQFIAELIFLSNEMDTNLAKPFYLSNNLTRSITGLLFGVGIGILVHSQLKKAVKEEIS
jgi:uncharacterized membrane protein